MDENYYRRLEERLTGVSVPMAVSDDDVPPVPENKLRTYRALQGLVNLEEFKIFMEFARQEATDLSEEFKARTSTNEALRVAKAQQEFAVHLGKAMVLFITDVDRMNEERRVWLDHQARKDTQQETATAL